MTAKKTGRAENKAPLKTIYVGPTIEGVSIQNVVYCNGIPDEAMGAIKEEPALSGLFVPLSDYSRASAMLNSGKGYIAEAYTKALEFKERKKGRKA